MKKKCIYLCIIIFFVHNFSQVKADNYQTSSPFRDYKLCYTKDFKDRRSAEQTAHKRLKKISIKYKGEWFKVSITEATKLIEAI